MSSSLLIEERIQRPRFSVGLAEKYDLLEATSLVDGIGYLTILAWCDLRGHLNYIEQNLIENWFQTFTMPINRLYEP